MGPKIKITHLLVLVILVAANPVTVSARENGMNPSLAWDKIDSLGMPSPRTGFSMTLNPDNQIALLFGGDSNDSGLLNELWLTNGSQWMEFPTLHRPTGRTGASLAYDRSRQEAVLFGGYDGASLSYLNDTWIFNGSDWVEQNPAASPSPRAGASLVYDPDRGRTYLFGGHYSHDKQEWLYNDTWAWDGENWQQLFPETQPAVRSRASVVYDPVHHNVLLYGGSSYAAPLNDTWIWNGETWTEQHPLHHPSTIYFSDTQMAFDESRQLVLMAGVNQDLSPNSWTETWAWDGQDWTQLPVIEPLPPELMSNGDLIYFPQLQFVALVNTFTQKVVDPGGSDALVDRSEVWVLYDRYIHYFPLISQ